MTLHNYRSTTAFDDQSIPHPEDDADVAAALDEQKAEPSAHDIQQLWIEVRHQKPRTEIEHVLAFARALLSKYAAPAPKGEPICYLNPKILGPDGRIGSHVRDALTWDRKPIGGWTMPVYAAPVNEQDAKDSIPVDDLVALLPGVIYMDPPDGGDVTVMEQLQRMAKDARRWRWLTDDHNDPRVRTDLRALFERLPVMSYSAACAAVDAAGAQQGKEGR